LKKQLIQESAETAEQIETFRNFVAKFQMHKEPPLQKQITEGIPPTTSVSEENLVPSEPMEIS